MELHEGITQVSIHSTAEEEQSDMWVGSWMGCLDHGDVLIPGPICDTHTTGNR